MTEKKSQKLFLTINAGKKPEAADNSGFKRYIGVAPVVVTAINPTKSELEKLYGYTVEQEPDYSFDRDDAKGIRLEIHVKTIQDKDNQIETTGRIRFFLSNKKVANRDKTKCQVIDEYGETTWVTVDQFKAGQRPDVCKVVGPYRICNSGEAELTKFIKEWLNFSSSTKWDSNTHRYLPVDAESLKKCAIKLNWEELCSGNIQELKDLVSQFADYPVKVCFGIRRTDDNRYYQDIYNHTFIRYSSRNYNEFNKDISSAKNAGLYQTTEFSSDFLREWHVQETTFVNTIPDTPASSSDIFGNAITTETETPENYAGSNDLPF